MTTGTPIALEDPRTSTSARATTARSPTVPARPRRPHLRAEIRHPRLSRRRPRLGARDRDAGRRRRGGARRCWARACASAARWCRSGRTAIDRARWDWAGGGSQPVLLPRPGRRRRRWEEVSGARCARPARRVGAVIEVVAEGVPPGLGAPVYGKLDADLAAALMGINAVKGVEIGDGFAAAALRGEENADEMRMAGWAWSTFAANHAGGILGGISTGQPIVARFAVKPTSSILTPRRAVDRDGRTRSRSRTSGRHDPASASAPCRWARRWWPGAGRPPAAAPRAEPGRAGRCAAAA